MSGSFVHRALTAVLSLVLLALIMGAHSLILSDSDQTEPIASSGDIGSTIDADRYTIKVEKVQITQSIADGDDSGIQASFETEEIWVIVWATVTSTSDTLRNVQADLDTGDGYTYSMSKLPLNAFGGTGAVFDPGIPVYGAVAFEVPKERLTDPTFRIRLGKGGQDRLSAQANVDLGLYGAELADMVDQAEETVTITPAERR
ncbi:MAG: hypothetical protein M0026_09790 [Nocardiopsaceae bacterium]|nr:hypothetical protein [Nocardiopsaceae bacterium]